MLLFCDLDGVLTDFLKAAHKLVPDWEHESYNIKWEIINSYGSDFWATLEWMPDGRVLWDYIAKHYPNTAFLTAIPRMPTARKGKLIWISSNLGPRFSQRAITCIRADKQKYAGPGRVLVDDHVKNIREWRMAGGIGVLHTGALSTILQLKALLPEKCSKSVYAQDRGQLLKVLGLCVKCGKTKSLPGKYKCHICCQRASKTEAGRRKKLAKKGLCIICGKRDVFPGLSRCLSCSEDTRLAQAKYVRNHPARARSQRKKKKQFYLDNGQCPICSAPMREWDDGHYKCITCRDGMHSPRGERSNIKGGKKYEIADL